MPMTDKPDVREASMREKMARAIRNSHEGRRRDEASRQGLATTDDIWWTAPAPQWALQEVDAALDAAMAPSEGFMRGFWREFDDEGIDLPPYHICEEALFAIWQAAIRHIKEAK